jgi:hypothetical protein
MTNTASTSVTGIVVGPRPTVDDETVFVVAGRDGSGQGPNTRLPSGIPGNMRAPVLDSVTLSVDDATITYTEDDDADAVDNYQIERNSGGGGYAVISTESVGAAQPQHVDSNLAAGTHTYRVRGYDSDTDTYTAHTQPIRLSAS